MSNKLSITALSKEEIQRRIRELEIAEGLVENLSYGYVVGQIASLQWVLENYDTGYYEKYESKVGLVVSGGNESQS